MTTKIESQQARCCKVCGNEMKLRKNGKYQCQPCHTKNVREKYSESRDRASKKFRKENPEKYAKMRRDWAIRIGGVHSPTSVRSRRSEKSAFNARQQWTIEGEMLVMSGKHTESQLAEMLGRSIRAIQRRKHKLRHAIEPNNQIIGSTSDESQS